MRTPRSIPGCAAPKTPSAASKVVSILAQAEATCRECPSTINPSESPTSVGSRRRSGFRDDSVRKYVLTVASVSYARFPCMGDPQAYGGRDSCQCGHHAGSGRTRLPPCNQATLHCQPPKGFPDPSFHSKESSSVASIFTIVIASSIFSHTCRTVYAYRRSANTAPPQVQDGCLRLCRILSLV